MAKTELHPETWVDRYADYLFNYAMVRVGDEDTAKDLVQETFIAGLKSAKNFEGNAAERTWLVAILKPGRKGTGWRQKPPTPTVLGKTTTSKTGNSALPFTAASPCSRKTTPGCLP